MAEIRDGRTYYGRVWTEGDYDDYVRPNALSVRVGEPGVKVVTVIEYLRDFDDDVDAVLRAWDPYLTKQDIADALAYYRSNEIDRSEIDQRLADRLAS